MKTKVVPCSSEACFRHIGEGQFVVRAVVFPPEVLKLVILVSLTAFAPDIYTVQPCLFQELKYRVLKNPHHENCNL
ncbi:hypothetical protein HanRHA438_Chr17g0841871 [Helianthus annuus]|nr:hypothetical protein HanRHA438_Chr17g0841871 [Helianthus annuus]